MEAIFFVNNIVKQAKRAFTLVELVIVIAVIAVLSAILIPVFSNVISDSRVAKLKQNLQTATTELILFSAEAGIDYYTPNQIKSYLALKGIDCSKPVEDGYSIWYDQKSFNLRLIENDSLFSLNGEAKARLVSNDSSLITPESILDNLGRRPEALTESKHLLLLATDEENIKVLDYIDGAYRKFDSNVEHAYNSIQMVNYAMQYVYTIPMLDKAPENVYLGWASDLDPSTTLYVNNEGKLITNYTGNSNKPIKNVVISPSKDIVIQPGVHETNGNINTTDDFKFDCLIELPENVKSIDNLQIKFANDSLKSIIALSQELDFESFNNTNAGNGIVTSKPSTAAGDVVNNISSSTGNVVVGGNDNPNIFYDTNLLKEKDANGNGHYSIVLDYDKKEVNAIANTTYCRPQLSIDLEAFKNTVKVAEGEGCEVKINTVKYYERKFTDYCDTVFTATYTVTKNGVSTIKAVKFDVGCGYITDLNIWYNRTDSGNIKNQTPISINSSSNFDPTVNVALPSGASYLSDYKNAKVKIYYTQVRKYYKEEISIYGKTFYTLLGSVDVGNEKSKQLDNKNKYDYYYFDSLSIENYNGTTPNGSTHYVDEVVVSKVEVLDNSDNVLFTKTYIE